MLLHDSDMPVLDSFQTVTPKVTFVNFIPAWVCPLWYRLWSMVILPAYPCVYICRKTDDFYCCLSQVSRCRVENWGSSTLPPQIVIAYTAIKLKELLLVNHFKISRVKNRLVIGFSPANSCMCLV